MKKWLLFAVCLLLPAPAFANLPVLTFITEEYPPYNYLTDDGDIDGESTRLLRAALEKSGLSARFRLLPWARAFAEAQLRDNHCVYSTARTPERESHFTWIGPLGANEWAAYSLADSATQAGSLDELESLQVGSFREDAAGQFVERQGISIVKASAERENIARLKAGLIDVWVSNVETATYLASEAEVELRQLFIFHAAQLYLACHPSVPENYATRLQSAIDRLHTAESVTLESSGETDVAQ
ncbi:ABC transporter substrate-binding protein [Halomonas sp. DQ26W]|uniref:substrate-binding periplasmic protein n=1 Tax=Halomonas sp. DQ26W TaxID=2282311 RepID=UPI000DF7751F|nr:transporter substrate-binding domain-containing protein [Halomonas sp. DQ26W]RDB42499.1 ABC transporter substrate-binding protein [Halomonas sp. DQ26W]